MTWIRTIPYAEAAGRLKTLYDRVKGPGDNVDNIMAAHSLRPHSMEGHMHLYKYVLHHSANAVPKHFLETLGVLVSHLNACSYCVEHHFQGLRRLLGDDDRANTIRAAFEAGDLDTPFDAKHAAALAYAVKLTRDPAAMVQGDVDALRAAGWNDGEILEINQVTAYFSYANRTVLGLGVSTEGDILGLSPGDNDDPDNWSHG
jgi:uncharacterized peroxidase-related enzyme